MDTSARKQRDKAQRRHKILSAADRTFKRSGYHEARIEDIANRAALSSSTIYIHFKGKKDLYAAV